MRDDQSPPQAPVRASVDRAQFREEEAARAVLSWLVDVGVGFAIDDSPRNRLVQPNSAGAAPRAGSYGTTPIASDPVAPAPVRSAPILRQRPEPPTVADAAAAASQAAGRAATLAELRTIVEGFGGCPLKSTATNLVFIDGAEHPDALFVGEAPGAEEDRLGAPFVGPSGQLLDRMLASIGLDRRNSLITNTVFWRPPGNRSPMPAEVASCAPFVERIIALATPRILVALGGPAAKALFGVQENVGRLRGRWFDYANPAGARPIPATAMFHPAYLLRSPAQKRLAWRDLTAIRRALDALQAP